MSVRPLLLIMAALLLGLGACQRQNGGGLPMAEAMVRYADLPLASASPDSELRAELARIAAEGGTPAALSGHRSSAPAQLATLRQLFPAESRPELMRKLLAARPQGTLAVAPLLRDEIMPLLDHSEEPRRAYQRLMLGPELPPVHVHRHGLAADLDYIQLVELGNRLEAAHIRRLLSEGSLKVELVLEPLRVMSRGVEWLAREKHLVPRLAAVELRAEWLESVSAVANHRQADRTVLAKLVELFDHVLQRWPEDAGAWIGERAHGLLIYELVRDGYLLSLLPYDQIRVYREQIGMEPFGKLVAEGLDADQLFYLRTMRQLIQDCSSPYYQRPAARRATELELERLRDTDRYPFVADQLLLVNVDANQQRQAVDRARCEAWRLALQAAAGQPADQPINPVDGRPFAVRKDAGRVAVGPVDPADAESMATIRMAPSS